MLPLAISRSSTCRGVSKVMDRPTPERFLSGATVSTSPTSSSALRASLRPAASIPSSFVNTIRIYQASSRVAGESFEQGFDSTIRLTHRMATLAERHPLRGAQCVTVKPPDVVLYASTPTKQQH